MSHALYSTALLWHVTRGVAKLHGVLAAVGEPLMLMGRRVSCIGASVVIFGSAMGAAWWVTGCWSSYATGWLTLVS